MINLYDCDNMVNMEKYVGCKINGYDGFNLIQIVMLQRFSNDFASPKQVPITPAMPGKTLTKSTEEDVKPPEGTT